MPRYLPPKPPGMLGRAAQAAAQVPPPGAPQPGAAGQPGAMQPPAPSPGGDAPIPTVAPPAAGAMGQPAPGGLGDTVPATSDLPGRHTDAMPPDSDQAYQPDFSMDEEPATEAEEREYARVRGALDKILYEEDNIADSVMQQMDGNDRIGSVTKASALTIQQLDEKVDMDEIVVAQITMDTVDAISEMAEARYGVSFSEQELQAMLGATWESVMLMFGADDRELSQFMEGFDPDQVGQYLDARESILNQGFQTPQGAAEEQAAVNVDAATPPAGARGGPQPMPGAVAPAAPPQAQPTGGNL